LPGQHDPDPFVRAQLRRNFLALGADFALFLVALSFASQTTVLPAFAVHLGAPNLVIGAIPAAMTAGWLLPSLFAAGHTATLSRRLPFVLRYTVWERVPFLVLALAAFVIAERAPAVAIATVLVSLVTITAAGGVLMPAWMDVVGRTIPTELRGRFFALWSTLASVGGLAGSFVTARVLAAVPPPAGFGVCFLVSAAFMALSYAALVATREPVVSQPASRTTLASYLQTLPALLARDRNFSWFLVARGLGILGAMATGFFTVHALRAHGAAGWHVGLFTTLLYAGQVLGNMTFGWLADRAGHRLVILAGTVAMLAANVVAFGASHLAAYSATFALVGLATAAANVSNQNVLLEFAPSLDARPTYVGLGNTVVAPLALAAPLVAGALVDVWSFERVFALAAGSSAAALVVLAVRVRDPRHGGPRHGRPIPPVPDRAAGGAPAPPRSPERRSIAGPVQ
jgi:MFS family permease